MSNEKIIENLTERIEKLNKSYTDSFESYIAVSQTIAQLVLAREALIKD